MIHSFFSTYSGSEKTKIIVSKGRNNVSSKLTLEQTANDDNRDVL